MEGNDLLHPLLTGGGTVGMNVHALWHLGVGLARHDPTAARKEILSIMKRQRTVREIPAKGMPSSKPSGVPNLNVAHKASSPTSSLTLPFNTAASVSAIFVDISLR